MEVPEVEHSNSSGEEPEAQGIEEVRRARALIWLPRFLNFNQLSQAKSIPV